MKIFVDTNIFLDLIQTREQTESAKIIFSRIESGYFSAYAADITLINIAYIARKQDLDIKKFLRYLVKYFTVVGAQNSEIEHALALNNQDFEDNVQSALAHKVPCQVIVTNDRTFIKEKIPVLTSSEFVKHHCL